MGKPGAPLVLLAGAGGVVRRPRSTTWRQLEGGPLPPRAEGAQAAREHMALAWVLVCRGPVVVGVEMGMVTSMGMGMEVRVMVL